MVDPEPVERAHLIGPETEPVHAGIDHHIGGAIRSDLLPAGDLLDAVENRAGRRVRSRLHIFGAGPMKNDQRAVIGHGPKLFRLGIGGNEESAAASLVQRLHRLEGANAIAVGLYGRACRDACPFLEPAEIMLERGSVEPEA